MSEEEIIKMLEHSINTYIEDTKVTKVELTTEQVQVLLDLYNKQKEEIEELKKPKDNIQVVYCGRSYEKTFKAKNYIIKEYISKDKIKNFANALIASKYWGNDAYIQGKNEESEEIGKELLELLEEK